MLQDLPLSTYTFRDIREADFLYVDKTRYVYQLVRPKKGVYFLSRPRRFGKSVLISTLESLFLGQRHLFEGLWIASSEYDWQPHPVLRLDFSVIAARDAEMLKQVIEYHTEQLAEQYSITLKGFDYQTKFHNLVTQLSQRAKVVILIDEYDKPILDRLGDSAEAQRVQAVLKQFYTILKGLDTRLRFVLITGVSKFSRVGVFSGLNHLTDLTARPDYATMLGLTQQELHAYFDAHIQTFARKIGCTTVELYEQIKEWYNGYRFLENSETLYNPFSIIHALDACRFANFWFETGTPTFLIELIKTQQFDVEQLNQLSVPEIAFSTYDVKHLAVLPLLFQTGYLTIKQYDSVRRRYQLGYPNREVEEAFTTYLLSGLTKIEIGFGISHLYQLVDALIEHQVDRFFTLLQTFFANIPYDLQVKQEKYYQTIFYLIFMLVGTQVEAEVKTNRGRIDTVITLSDRIYLFEFKLDGDADEALKQIVNNRYFEKYRHAALPLTLIGANFDTKERNVTRWKTSHRSASLD